MAKESKKVVNIADSKIQVLSELLARASLANRLGNQYGGDRDLYQALGYKTDPDFYDYFAKFLRNPIAKAVINRPTKMTWQGELKLLQSDKSEDTPLEKGWLELMTSLKLKSVFSRLDQLAGIGQYGVLLFGFNDVQSHTDFAQPVKGGARKLLYLKPLSQESALIQQYVRDTTSPRYGLPEIYNITISEPNGGISQTMLVHHTRILHVVDELLESEVHGSPRLEVVYNALDDIEKIVGGSGEMYWRGARPGFTGTVDKDYQLTAASKADLQDQFDEYEHNLRRFLINEGIDISAMQAQVSDPSAHLDVQLQLISAVTGIPKRILVGSERGELASTQDKESWLGYITSRRGEYAEPIIVRPFIARCMEYSVLPKVEKYDVAWDELYSISESEKVGIGKSRTEALSSYAGNPLNQDILPPNAFFEYFLGLSVEQIELITQMREEAIEQEEDDAAKEAENAPPAPTTPPVKEPTAKELIDAPSIKEETSDIKTQADKDQPRVPKGNPDGGQWARSGSSGASFPHDADGKIIKDAKWTGPDGELMPEDFQKRAKEINVRKDLTDIWLNPNHDPMVCRAMGLDSKGRPVPNYSKEFRAAKDAEKFVRVAKLDKVIDKVKSETVSMMNNKELSVADRDTAAVSMMIQHTGMRPGSNEDTLADVKAYGATTLEGQHISVNDNDLTFKFIAKKGVPQTFTVRNAELAKYINGKDKRDGVPVFSTSADKVLDFTKRVSGIKELKTKDYRTWNANDEAINIIKKMPFPKNKKEYNAARKLVATAASNRIQNTPAMALKSYIDPAVFLPWEQSIAKGEK